MRIMLYSQHVLGIGHFFRSMEIARALKDHEVLFVEGGDPLPGFLPPNHVSRFLLPPLMMDAEFKSLGAGDGGIEEVKTARRKLLLDKVQDFAPQVFLTELFPFGRRQFRFELLPVLKFLRERLHPVRVICSLRDILVEKDDQASYERWVLDILNSNYDLLLIHSDPRLIALEETFSQVDAIRIPIQYTGFICKPLPSAGKRPEQKVIVASSGGGKVGVDLLAATIVAVQSLPDSRILLRVFIGPFMEMADQETLHHLARRDARTVLHPFSPDFQAELTAADLSISMAGYNTCMDLISTKVRALVFPFPQNREQGLRARKLARLGLVEVIRRPDAVSLAGMISDALGAYAPHPDPNLDLGGAAKTARLINAFATAGPSGRRFQDPHSSLT
jgi:predicted glycosyltransferase